MSIRLYKTLPNQDDFYLFGAVKNQVYPENSIGRQQSDDLNQEFLVMCLVVIENDIPVGRLALYNNPELRWKEEKACCIGNFECVNKIEIARLMQHETEIWAKEKGFKTILGPMNGSTWDNYRFSSHHNNPLFLSEPFHPLYYNTLFLELGFEVILNYQSRIERGIRAANEKVANKIKDAALNGLVIREFDASRIEEELEKLFPFVKAAFERNTLYTPISRETFYRKYTAIIKQIGTRYVLLAERNKELIAFVFAFQNFFETTKKQLIYKTVARKYGKENTGCGHLVALEVMKRALEDGVEDAIHAFMIYDATSTEISGNFNSQPYKEYVLYAKQIADGKS